MPSLEMAIKDISIEEESDVVVDNEGLESFVIRSYTLKQPMREATT